MKEIADVTMVTAGSVAKVKQEYREASNRIDQALNTLKGELMAMRQQDVQLLKQLINISQTIQRLRRNQCLRATRSLSLSGQGLALSTSSDVWRRPPLVRQRSVPQSLLLDRQLLLAGSHSQSSAEGDLVSSPDDYDLSSGSELEDSTTSLPTLRRLPPFPFRGRTLTCQTFGNLDGCSSTPTLPLRPLTRQLGLSSDLLDGNDDTSYDEILRRNIRLWKLGVSSQPETLREDITCII